MRILSFGHGSSGCWWVRIKTPLEQLAKKHAVILTDGKKQMPLNCWQIVIFNNIVADIEVIEDGKEKKTTLKKMVEDFKKNGSKIVYDIDDAMEVHPHKDDFGGVIDKNMDSYWYLLKNADLVTVTTKQLKKHISKFTKRPIAVLPNCITPQLFPQRKKSDKIKIGFAGSTSHIPDLDIVMPAIEKLRKKYGIYFETLGFQKGFYKWKKPVPIDKYYQAVADLGADIGICPLKESVFNQNKSPLKFLEYSMVGSMVLASNRYPYKGEMKDEWLVDDDKWEETLEKYILDKKLREKTAKEQKEWVLANRDITKEYIRWEKEYKKLC